MDDQDRDAMPRIVGIVNLSEDSFSDGGRYGDPDRAARHARDLLADGAHWIELGAASSHPDAADIAPSQEIEALEQVLVRLEDVIERVGVDTWKPDVQRYCIDRDVAFINDISGFEETQLHSRLAQAGCNLVVMHSVQRGKATRSGAAANTQTMDERACAYLHGRVGVLSEAGIDKERLIVDPGMGFFLGPVPEDSFDVLAGTASLKRTLGLPVLISVSRKSFLGAVTGRDVDARAAATLAAELAAARSGANYLRTHDVAALSDGLRVQAALAEAQMRRRGGAAT